MSGILYRDITTVLIQCDNLCSDVLQSYTLLRTFQSELYNMRENLKNHVLYGTDVLSK